MATAASPVAGLFVGIVAAALWIDRRRGAAYALGLPPVVVVALSSWLFPFSGHQPMPLVSTILPVAFALAIFVMAPTWWRTVRIGSLLYAAGVLAVWAVPSQIGTNMTRLGLIFGGVLILAVAVRTPATPLPHRWPAVLHTHRGRFALLLAVGILTSSIWQVATAARDVIDTRPSEAWTVDVDPLVHQLQARHAERARVEVVPAASHREASALAPYVNLARGLEPAGRRRAEPHLLHRGHAHAAVLPRLAATAGPCATSCSPTGAPDHAAVQEATLVAGGLRYLHEVWSDESWRLFEVRSPTPLADPPATVTGFDAAEVVIRMPRAGSVMVRIPSSPWLSLVDEDGQPLPGPGLPGAGAPVGQPLRLPDRGRAAGGPGRGHRQLDGPARTAGRHLPHRRPLQAAEGHELPRRHRGLTGQPRLLTRRRAPARA